MNINVYSLELETDFLSFAYPKPRHKQSSVWIPSFRPEVSHSLVIVICVSFKQHMLMMVSPTRLAKSIQDQSLQSFRTSSKLNTRVEGDYWLLTISISISSSFHWTARTPRLDVIFSKKCTGSNLTVTRLHKHSAISSVTDCECCWRWYQ